jgi:hypothetical protein
MEFHDGIGASQLQTKKGTSPADLVNINHGAIAMAFPLAKTVAIKDACDHFGKLFGCDLNRRDTLNFSIETVSTKTESGVDPEIEEQFNLITDIESLDKYVAGLITNFPKLNHNMAFRSLLEKTKNKLKPR